MEPLNRESITIKLPRGLDARFEVWQVGRWSWGASAHLSGIDAGVKPNGLKIIPVSFGEAGWTTRGAVVPFKRRSRELALGAAFLAVADSAWAKP